MVLAELHPIQEDILQRLGYDGPKRFSELQGDTPSNKLSFHLDRLQENDLIQEVDGGYRLTAAGTEAVPYLDMAVAEQPISVAALFLADGDTIYLDRGSDAVDVTTGLLQPPAARLQRGGSLQEHAARLHRDRFDTSVPDLRLAAVFETVVRFENGAAHDYLVSYLAGPGDGGETDWYTSGELEDGHVVPGMAEAADEILAAGGVVHGTWTLTYSDGELELDGIEFHTA
ncbi:MAG: hypothetical protein ABEI97_02495 [Candidatus Nanohaloarchaea archaeon]